MDEAKKRAREMLLEGKTMKEARKATGVSDWTIRKLREELNEEDQLTEELMQQWDALHKRYGRQAV